MHPSFEEISCNICGRNETRTIYESTLPQDLSLEVTKRFAPADHTKGNDRIVQCLHCGFIYSSPRMKQEYIWQGYSEAVDDKYATQAEARMTTFKRALKTIQQYLPQKGKILDVGCAAGFFLKVASDAGWDAHGIEPNKGLAEFGRTRYGVNIVTENFLSIHLPSNSFDAVTLWDVIEHVPDPRAYMREVLRILKPGGYFFVNIPDFGSIFAKLSGKKWWFLSPVHIYYFNRITLKKMLAIEGFTVVTIRMHWQTLALGYLFERFTDYNSFLSKIGIKICKFLGISKLPIRYYASQALAVAQKPK